MGWREEEKEAAIAQGKEEVEEGGGEGEEEGEGGGGGEGELACAKNIGEISDRFFIRDRLRDSSQGSF